MVGSTGTKKARINERTTARLHNTGSVVLLISLIAIFFYLQIRRFEAEAQGHPEISEALQWWGYGLIVISIVLFALSLRTPVGYFIESVSSTEFKFYYQVGWFELGSKKYFKHSEEQLKVEQDSDRYFNIQIRLANDDKLIIERYPTQDIAEGRCNALRSILL